MSAKARPTQRCLLEDLRDSLDNRDQRSALAAGRIEDLGSLCLDEIEHQLLAKATEQISGRLAAELHEFRIKSVRDITFYKVKVGQWRGAVWIDSEGRPWLCAAGLRRDGDSSDFYEELASESSCEKFLPNRDDIERLERDRLANADDARLFILRARVISSLLAAADDLTIKSVALPVAINSSGEPIDGATLTVEVIPGDQVDPGTLTLSIKITNFSAANFDDVLVEVRTALPGLSDEDWDVIPAINGFADPCWFAYLDTRWMDRLREAVASLGLEDFVASPPSLTDGADGWAHIVPDKGLTEAIVEGRVIRGLCGRRFISTRDPNDHEMCPECLKVRAELERVLNESMS